MSIECTTSANNTVTCLYSAGVSDTAVGEPHSSQNFAVGRNSAAHLEQANAAVMRPTIGRSPAKSGLFAAIHRLAGHAVRQDGGHTVALVDAVTLSVTLDARGAPKHSRAQQPGSGVDQRGHPDELI
jgi:hypothetical protein